MGFHTTFATDSLQSLMDHTGMTKTFVGIVVLPLLTNDLEPIKAAWTNKMDLLVAVTIGKCLQTALFVIPVMVLIAWAMGMDGMSLSFDGFEVATLLALVLYIDFMILDGRTN